MAITDADQRIPAVLRTSEFVLRPITADDAARDHDAVLETRDDLRRWEQSTWPADDFTVEANRQDLEDLARRHAERRAFTYTVVDPEDVTCLGCVYVFPTTATFLARSTVTAVDEAVWDEMDAVVYFWVRRSRVRTHLDARLLTSLRAWFTDDWRLSHTVFVISERFDQQMALLESTDLRPLFEIAEPGKAGRYIAFG
ncbi:hypothetical protein [Tersicoccus sp. Bi-70]|uniref:hypothetical protein n=1 Tax=Tersicoccus sp. Bi-70 TaxID=1897634 RepID=UPI0009771F89|nr:hypothetical protein [Tersicoccus sp. Bi-70]OMH31299.1 hypothetical protein BGP79_09740 [Tersicoccus sp. Bi-70]